MGIVYNPTKENVTTKMQGSWFSFKPGALKPMDDDKCRFISENRKDTGLVILPIEFQHEDGNYDRDFAESERGKKVLEEKGAEGIRNMLEYHKMIIRNNQVSLRADMAKAHPAGDSARLAMLEMSDGEKRSLEIVAKYQKNRLDEEEKKLKEVQKLLNEAGPIGE